MRRNLKLTVGLLTLLVAGLVAGVVLPSSQASGSLKVTTICDTIERCPPVPPAAAPRPAESSGVKRRGPAPSSTWLRWKSVMPRQGPARKSVTPRPMRAGKSAMRRRAGTRSNQPSRNFRYSVVRLMPRCRAA